MTGPVRDDRRRIAIATNPYGGAPSHRRPAEALAAALARRGLEPHVFWERRKRRAALADPDLGRSWRCAVAVGGDGTVADVINEMPPGLPLAVLPAGNENLFARALGSPADPETLAAAILAGRTRRIDLGRAGRRLFSLMVGIGFDAEVAHRVARRRRGPGSFRPVGRWRYLLPILGALRRLPPGPVEVQADGVRARGAHCLVFNLPHYACALPLAGDARPDDGLLDWIVLERPGRLALARYSLAVLRSAHLGRPDVRHGRARHLRIVGGPLAPVQLDGDPAGFTPVEIEVLADALAVIVP
ncbi:MAG: diacylglycerol kinase [Candidatus Rokuibacteriota bacterium]|nr:MAG: diacylglycerol kinase [Candidatus Rokubacteria bacterium]